MPLGYSSVITSAVRLFPSVGRFNNLVYLTSTAALALGVILGFGNFSSPGRTQADIVAPLVTRETRADGCKNSSGCQVIAGATSDGTLFTTSGSLVQGPLGNPNFRVSASGAISKGVWQGTPIAAEYISASNSASVSLIYATSSGSTKVTSSSETAFSKTVNMTGSTITAGDVWDVAFTGETKNTDGSNTSDLRIKVGSTTLVAFPRLNVRDATGPTWQGKVRIHFVTTGASSMVRVTSEFYCGKLCSLVGGTPAGATGVSGSGSFMTTSKTIDLTANPKLQLTIQQANGTANNFSHLLHLSVIKSSSATALR